MKLKSVAILTHRKTKTRDDVEEPEFVFLRSLHRDLQSFGRDDVSLIVAGTQAVFSWSALYNKPASRALRLAVGRSRLQQDKDRLRSYEDAHTENFSTPFDVDTDKIEPAIVDCGDDPDRIGIFEYHAHHQSMTSKVARGRFARFLVYDNGAATRPLMGIIGLSSPVYFNGARDGHLGWGPVGRRVNGVWEKDPVEKRRRDSGLLNISHVTIATAVHPYDELKAGKLLSTLCFSEEVIGTLEDKYGEPIAGLSTTGGWGINAAPYQRIKLGRRADGSTRDLFEKVEPKAPSLNTSFKYFSDETLLAALNLHKARSEDSSAEMANHAEDISIRSALLRWALTTLGIPRRAVYVNEIGHFFGTCTDASIEFLSDTKVVPVPNDRAINIADAMTYWRARTNRSELKSVVPSRLSEGV